MSLANIKSARESLGLAIADLHAHNNEAALDARLDPETQDMERSLVDCVRVLSQKLRADRLTGRSDRYVPDFSDEEPDDY